MTYPKRQIDRAPAGRSSALLPWTSDKSAFDPVAAVAGRYGCIPKPTFVVEVSSNKPQPARYGRLQQSTVSRTFRGGPAARLFGCPNNDLWASRGSVGHEPHLGQLFWLGLVHIGVLVRKHRTRPVINGGGIDLGMAGLGTTLLRGWMAMGAPLIEGPQSGRWCIGHIGSGHRARKNDATLGPSWHPPARLYYPLGHLILRY